MKRWQKNPYDVREIEEYVGSNREMKVKVNAWNDGQVRSNGQWYT